jgi:hypothetical protein
VDETGSGSSPVEFLHISSFERPVTGIALLAVALFSFLLL